MADGDAAGRTQTEAPPVRGDPNGGEDRSQRTSPARWRKRSAAARGRRCPPSPQAGRGRGMRARRRQEACAECEAGSAAAQERQWPLMVDVARGESIPPPHIVAAPARSATHRQSLAKVGGRSGSRWNRESELARSEHPRQLRVDAGEARLGVGGGVASGAAKGRRGGEEALSVLSRGDEIGSTQSAGKRGYRPIPERQAGTDAAGSWPGQGAGWHLPRTAADDSPADTGTPLPP